MTRKSRREIERELEQLADERDGSAGSEIVIRDTVIATDWGDEETEPGTVIEEDRTVIEL